MPERILGTWRWQERRPRRVKRSISTEPPGSWSPPAWIKKGNCKSSAAVSETEALMSSGRARLAWLRDQGGRVSSSLSDLSDCHAIIEITAAASVPGRTLHRLFPLLSGRWAAWARRRWIYFDRLL
ncbi:hypothetical protein E4U44_008407 [Claviceps purpurea]|nr:hypothetical protein E4U44_008407 [Claviceps purpurea]